MILQDYKIEGDSITITKKELTETRDHYGKVADKFKPKPKSQKEVDLRYPLYLGKVEVINDILKMFEPLEG